MSRRQVRPTTGCVAGVRLWGCRNGAGGNRPRSKTSDTVSGIPDSRTEIGTLRPPGGGTGIELSSFVRPDHAPGSPAAMANELGLRNVCFKVADLDATVDGLAADGYGMVGGIGQYESIWRMGFVRGPEGIVVALAERIG